MTRPFLATFALLCGVFAQSVRDPGIPHGEFAEYRVVTGNKTNRSTQRVHRQREGGLDAYVIDNFSEEMDLHVVAARSNLFAYQSRTIQKGRDARVIRETRFEDVRIAPRPGTIDLLDFTGIDLLFRGLLFEGKKSAALRFVGAGSDSPFKIEIQDAGPETLRINDRDYACNKVQLTLAGIWSAFIPKSTFWYEAKAPHVLVKYDGQQGPPGSPRRVMELVKYGVQP
ncbi:MAG: hypothetical protein J0L75_03045 [Spirochaetes bacterium]|nr:hypothetical protein [Spirochaetota bacterium]